MMSQKKMLRTASRRADEPMALLAPLSSLGAEDAVDDPDFEHREWLLLAAAVLVTVLLIVGIRLTG
jgi:hypothetical protein